jgi:hypothetical protein
MNLTRLIDGKGIPGKTLMSCTVIFGEDANG